MNTSKQEYLSAWLDDEAGDFERRRLLDELHHDDELGQTLSRYALIGEAMRSINQPAIANSDFLANLHKRLDEEAESAVTAADEVVIKDEALLAQPKLAETTPAANDRRVRWYQYGMAAAVTVAFVGGMLVQQNRHSAPTLDTANTLASSELKSATEQAATSMPAVQPASAVAHVDTQLTRTRRPDPQARDRLDQYIAQHVRYASTSSIVPSVRAVSYSNDY